MPKGSSVSLGFGKQCAGFGLEWSQPPVPPLLPSGTSVLNVQAASASRFGGKYPAEYNVYEIEEGMLKTIHRRVFNAEREAFTNVIAYDYRTQQSNEAR